MASKPKNTKQNDSEQDSGPEIPEMPKLPPKDGRSHKATYAKDKKKGGYLVRVIGPHAARMSNRWVPVTRMDDTENMEYLTGLIWSGVDEETGKPVALYSMHKFERKDVADEIPF